MRIPPRRACSSIVPLLLLTAGTVPLSCSGVRPATPGGALRQGDAAADPTHELDRLDAAQRRAGRVPETLPPALDLPSLHPRAPTTPQAGVGLHDALAELAAAAPRPEPVDEAGAVDPAAADEALRLYVAGRVDLEAARLTEAIAKLRSASRLNPASERIWEALGEAQLRSGLARAASDSFTRAAALGSRNPTTLLALARSAQQQEDHGRAVGRLALLAAGEDAAADPALRAIVHTSLGQSLIALRYENAGVEALARGLDLPQTFAQPTPYYEELGEVFRRRADLWRLAGDTLCGLSRYEDALGAYERAATFPSLDPAAILPRRIYAALRLGRPARAAIAIHDELARADGPQRLEPRHIALIRELSHHDPRTGAALSSAILAQRDARLPGLADSLSARLARAAAAALPPDRAAAMLQARLAENPLDAETLADLLALTPEGDAAAAASSLAVLVGRAPLHADTIAQTVTRPELRARAGAAVSAGELIAALERQRRTVGSRLLLAAMQVRTSEPGSAAPTVEALRKDHPADPAVNSLAVTIGARLGRWDVAEPALNQLAGDPATPPAVLARALSSFQRFGPALDAIEASLAGSPRGAPIADLLLGAEAAATLGRYEDQERYLRRAVETDPYSEPAYLPLLRLYVDGGPLPDRQKLADIVRRLREAVPSSRILRQLRAEEFMAGGRTGPGQRDLLTLAEEDPFDAAPFPSLIAEWLHPRNAAPAAKGVLSSAAPALDALIAAHPSAPWPIAARATLAAVLGDADTLTRLTADRPPATDPPEVAAALEGALRHAGRAAEADAWTAARLEAAPPNIDNAIEYSTFLVRLGQLARAGEVIAERLPEGVTLTSPQTLRMLQAAEAATRSADGIDPDPEEVAALLDRVFALVTAAPIELHRIRLGTLLALPEPSVDALLAATWSAAAQHPEVAESVYQLVAARLAELSEETTLEFLARAVLQHETPNPGLYRQWVAWSVSIGGPEDAVSATRAAIDAGMTAFILEPEEEELEAAAPPTPPELAYRLGVIVASGGVQRHPTAIALYELAVELEPEHGWACNNLGYMLLERDGPSDRANALLETAFRVLPDQSSVVDSIGWLRYKQGVLDDEVDAEGNVLRLGAVSLLVRASELVGDDNPVITDHLGDALWAQGDRAQAVAHWRLAEGQARRQIELLRRSTVPQTPAVTDLRQRLQSLVSAVRAKQNAVSRGRKPAVAPIPGRDAAGPEPEPVPEPVPHDA